VGLCIPLLALFIPYILGIEYAETSRILLWLAPIPLLRSFSFLAADALTGAGYQGLRSVVQIGIALGNLGMNLLLIPKHGWLGAAWSSLISDGLLALVLCGLSIALLLRIKERNGKKV
jgi:O-antigen/teichoic acid export membrane protein